MASRKRIELELARLMKRQKALEEHIDRVVRALNDTYTTTATLNYTEGAIERVEIATKNDRKEFSCSDEELKSVAIDAIKAMKFKSATLIAVDGSSQWTYRSVPKSKILAAVKAASYSEWKGVCFE